MNLMSLHGALPRMRFSSLDEIRHTQTTLYSSKQVDIDDIEALRTGLSAAGRMYGVD